MFSLPPRRTMSTSANRAPVRAATGRATVLALALALLLSLGAVPALAHDELASSSPEAGATVESLPETLELNFSSVPSGIGAQVQVLDGSGTDWAEGPVRITDTKAVQALRAGAPAGKYTVNWRVVSSDSHPIEGTFGFTAEAAGTGAVPDAAGTAVPIETPDAGGEQEQAAGVGGFPWSIAVMIAVLLALAVALALTARRKLGSTKK